MQLRDRVMINRFLPHLLVVLLTWMFFPNNIAIASEVPKVRFSVKSFVLEGENPLSEKATQKTLSPFIGEHEGLDRIEKASQALQQALYDKGYSFHRVIVPPQTAMDGVIKLKILTFKLDKVTVVGNMYFSDKNVLAGFPSLKKGKTPNTLEVARSMRFANEHPAKNLAVFVSDSEEPESIDARIEIQDTRPRQFFSSYSNTGERVSGRTRLSLGYQYSNVFNRDHIFTVSYTTSPGHFSEVQQWGGHYRLPIYSLCAGLSMFYTYSKVDQGTVGEFLDVDVTGKGTFAGVSMDYTFRPLEDYNHTMDLGIQDKFFKNDTSFSGILIGTNVRSTPVSISYTGSWEQAKFSGSFYLAYVRNLGFGGNNDTESYLANRAGADREWNVLRYGIDMDYILPRNFLLRYSLSGQESNEPLILGEQFGLGGASSIRGFEEREMSGDSGQQINIEIWSPPLSLNTRILGFYDMGRIYLDEPVAGQDRKDVMSSFGMGLRWQWKTNLMLSCDMAHVTKGNKTTKSGDEKIHFNLFLRF